jgi:hypothetical protein
MQLLLAAVVITYSSTIARSELFDGNELFDLCKKAPQILNGYVAGVADKSLADTTFAEFWAPDRKSKDSLKKVIRPFCIPDGVQLVQMKDVVCKYLTDAPNQRHYAGPVIVQTALAERFPCSQN